MSGCPRLGTLARRGGGIADLSGTKLEELGHELPTILHTGKPAPCISCLPRCREFALGSGLTHAQKAFQQVVIASKEVRLYGRICG